MWVWRYICPRALFIVHTYILEEHGYKLLGENVEMNWRLVWNILWMATYIFFCQNFGKWVGACIFADACWLRFVLTTLSCFVSHQWRTDEALVLLMRPLGVLWVKSFAFDFTFFLLFCLPSIEKQVLELSVTLEAFVVCGEYQGQIFQYFLWYKNGTFQKLYKSV